MHRHKHTYLITVLLKLSAAQNTTKLKQTEVQILGCDPYPYLFYDLTVCLFSSCWQFNVFSKSRLFSNLIAKDCLCSLLQAFIYYYLLFFDTSSFLFLGGGLRPALTFSYLWVSLSIMFPTSRHNCCTGVNFGKIFSKSITSFPPNLPLPLTPFSIVSPCFPTTTSSIILRSFHFWLPCLSFTLVTLLTIHLCLP